MKPQLSTVIVGTKYRGNDAVTLMVRLRAGDEIALSREPDNEHDRNAVACTVHGQHIGYIPKAANPLIAAALDEGMTVSAIVTEPAQVRRSAGRSAYIKREPKLLVAWEPRERRPA